MSCSVQHVIPQSVDPLRIWDPMNWEPAHLRCNKEAGASLPPSLGEVEDDGGDMWVADGW